MSYIITKQTQLKFTNKRKGWRCYKHPYLDDKDRHKLFNINMKTIYFSN